VIPACIDLLTSSDEATLKAALPALEALAEALQRSARSALPRN
jgi:hypothetical protein